MQNSFNYTNYGRTSESIPRIMLKKGAITLKTICKLSPRYQCPKLQIICNKNFLMSFRSKTKPFVRKYIQTPSCVLSYLF